MRTPAFCLILALLAASVRGEEFTLWLTVDEKLTGPAVSWDGSAQVSDGGKVTVREWLFEQGDQADGAVWQAQTQHGPETARLARNVRISPLGKGLLLDVSGPLSATLTCTTKLGAFSVPLAEVNRQMDLDFLEGRIRLRRLPGVQSLTTGGQAEEEFPSVAILPDGRAAVAYVAWDGTKDRVWLRRGEQSEPLTEAGDFLDPRLAVNGAGELWCVWAAYDGRQWDLWGRQPGKPAMQLTRSAQNDFWPRLARAVDGKLWLAWQAVEGDLHYEVKLAQLGPQGLSLPINVSEDGGDDWEPAICATSDGRIVVAWDTYRHGSFDVYLREFRHGKPAGPGQPVAASAEREAHASVAADAQGRVWIAWDVSMEDWGKHPTPGGTLHSWRRSEVACLEQGKLLRPAQPLMEAAPLAEAKWMEYPVVAVDGQNRVWVISRFANDVHPLARPGKGRQGQTHTMWMLFAHCYQGSAWSRAILLPGSHGRQDMRLETARDAEGHLLVCFAGDNRSRLRPAMPVDHDVFLASLRGFGPAASPPAQVVEDSRLGKITPAAPDPEQKALPRQWSLGGKSYRLLLGDTHRHTDISQCNNGGDGSLQDAYRYALDAYQLDWLAISDHDQDILKHRADRDLRPRQDYAWWRSQKFCDLYSIPGRFLALYGYEHGGTYQDRGGHKNVISSSRGRPVHEEDSPEELFRVLANSGCVAIPHQLADGAARTDWDKWNAEFERVGEIFQARGNYEFADCPREARAVTPGNFLWDALAKGVRIGIIASSDHGQTHIANAGVWAEDFTRAAILDDLRARRTLGGTTKVSLQVSVAGQAQGQEIELDGTPTLEAKLAAAAPLTLVQVVRDGRFVHTAKPNAPETSFTFIDSSLQPGQSAYYYIRAELGDGDLAWSSPLWVRRRP